MAGIGGIVVSPAPSRAVRIRWLPELTRRVAAVPLCRARAEPIAVDESRWLAREAPDGAGPSGDVAADPSAPASAELPHTSQYPSRTCPVQPGWAHGVPLGTEETACG